MSGESPGPSRGSGGALEGTRVLDLTRYIPGPYCTLLLGDLGADVVKVEEPPAGDPTRVLPPAVGQDGAAHAALNRNKRSILVDLRREEGAAVVRRLALGADVLVEAFRPGVLARRGLGPQTLRAQNPRLIYCSLTGYGQDGPLSSRAGHDLNYMALGGLLGTLRDGQDGPPVLPAAQLADMTGGLLATIGILAALQARARTGQGQVVDVSMLEGVLGLMTVPATRFLAGGTPCDELAGGYACYNVYRCRDGRYLSVGALEPKFWEALCRALGLEDRLGRQWEGAERRGQTIEAFAHVLATRDRDEWVEVLSRVDACVEPVLDLGEALAQPQAQRGLLDQASGDARFRAVATPIRLSATPTSVRREAPGLGAHGGELLAEAGYSRAEIERMRVEGVVA